jgi:hypothetical protein
VTGEGAAKYLAYATKTIVQKAIDKYTSLLCVAVPISRKRGIENDY